MLSVEENLGRQLYYREVFPKSTFQTIRKRRPRLWPIKRHNTVLNELKKLGFKDPEKIIILNPEILSRKEKWAKKMTEHLKKNSFENPVSLLSSNPSIFCLSLNNIDRKLCFARRVGYTRFCNLVAYYPMILSYSIKRYFLVTRILMNHEDEVTFSLIVKTFKLTSQED